jgi:hypothetical protein
MTLKKEPVEPNLEDLVSDMMLDLLALLDSGLINRTGNCAKSGLSDLRERLNEFVTRMDRDGLTAVSVTPKKPTKYNKVFRENADLFCQTFCVDTMRYLDIASRGYRRNREYTPELIRLIETAKVLYNRISNLQSEVSDSV